MFNFLKRWNDRAGKPGVADEIPSVADPGLEALPDDDLEAVVGGLANSEQMLRSLRALHDTMQRNEANQTPYQQ